MENESSEKIIEIQINENTILQFESLFYGIGDNYPILADCIIESVQLPFIYGTQLEEDEIKLRTKTDLNEKIIKN